jgi:hypothetical protein
MEQQPTFVQATSKVHAGEHPVINAERTANADSAAAACPRFLLLSLQAPVHPIWEAEALLRTFVLQRCPERPLQHCLQCI